MNGSLFLIWDQNRDNFGIFTITSHSRWKSINLFNLLPISLTYSVLYLLFQKLITYPPALFVSIFPPALRQYFSNSYFSNSNYLFFFSYFSTALRQYFSNSGWELLSVIIKPRPPLPQNYTCISLYNWIFPLKII